MTFLKSTRLLLVFLSILSVGCTASINLDERASDTMAAHFQQNTYHRNLRVECGPGLSNYVYQGYPKGLTGSEVKASIPIGKTFCTLLDQAETSLREGAGEAVEVVLNLKSISFTYSFEGTALWAQEGRDFDAAYILIRLAAESGSRFREYTIMSQKERFDSTDGGVGAIKYAVVNDALEDVIMQLYSKLYRDF